MDHKSGGSSGIYRRFWISVSGSGSLAGRPVPGCAGGYARYFKRPFDLCLVLIGIPIILPVFALLYLLVRRDGGPFLYSHLRIGLDGKPFGCLKVRTMVVDADRALQDVLENDPTRAREWRRSFKLQDDPRVTGLGRKLRATSLDELPQLFNVLKGDMSLIGPRPVTAAELAEYGAAGAEAYRSVRPGLTGLWQVTSRRDNDFQGRAAIDSSYVQNLSFTQDLKILLKTVPEVLFAHGC